MISFSLKPDVKAMRKLEKDLAALGAVGAGRAIRKGIRKAAKPILREAKNKVPVKHKLLRKSLGVKVKTYSNTGIVTAIVGARTGFKKEIDGKMHNPANYCHLVELGTKRAAAKPFLRPAIVETEDEVKSIFTGAVSAEIKKEIIKRSKKRA